MVSGRIPHPIFKRVYEHGKSAANKFLVLYYLSESDGEEIRLGVSVPRRLGKAVVRNRAKRRVKEAFRRITSEFPVSGQFVFIVREAAARGSFEDILTAMRDLLKRMGLL